MVKVPEKIRTQLIEKWEKLTPEAKRKFVILIAVGLIGIGFGGVMWSKKSKQMQVSPANTTANKTVALETVDSDLLKKAQYYETKKMIEDLQKSNEELKKQLETMQKEKETKKVEKEEVIPKTAGRGRDNVLPPPPPPPGPVGGMPQGNVPPPAPPKPAREVLQGIQVVEAKVQSMSSAGKVGSQEEAREEGEQKEAKEKKEVKEVKQVGNIKKKYYLPPSFMVATLLSGSDFPAMSKGEGHPVPVLLRIKTPAVLPNEVRANVKGCFLIAEGLGNLASERADIRLVSLSCIDRKGKAVLDQKIKGFIVDTDGKIGLRGRVVSKMGSTLARALLAGLASGVAQGWGTQGYSYTTSPQGTLIVPEPGKILSSGIAGGLQSAANELVKFYMELARQSVPVVEVLPVRNVTAVISEGVELVVKDLGE